MLDIAFELIGEATSNSLLMFCFCNLIIVIIFAGSSKPGSIESHDSTFTTSVSFSRSNIACDDDDGEMILAAISSAQDGSLINDSDEYEERESSHCCNVDEEMVLAAISSEQDESLISESSVSEEEEEEEEEEDRESSHCCDDDDVDEGKHVEVEEDEGDDDLRKRAEEFIAKINNEWRYEKLRALNLVY